MAGRTPQKPPPTRFAPAQANTAPVQAKAAATGHHPPPTKFGRQTFQAKPAHATPGLPPPTSFGPQAVQAMKSTTPSYKDLNPFTRCALYTLNGALGGKVGWQKAYEELIATAKAMSSKKKTYSYDDDEVVEATFVRLTGAKVIKGKDVAGITAGEYMDSAEAGRYAISVKMDDEVSHIFLVGKAKKKSDPVVLADSESKSFDSYASGILTCVYKLP